MNKLNKLITTILRDWVLRNEWVLDYKDESDLYAQYGNLKSLLAGMNENEEFILINTVSKKVRVLK